MSFDSDDEGEWEVVDIVHTTTSVKPTKKDKPAKKEDVDKLAQDIQSMLSLKSTHDTQQILLLEQKMKQQQKMSEQQLAMIQSKLAAVTTMQQKQEQQQRDLDKQRRELEERQKQQLLEQKIRIQSLSDHQILTQKQLVEAHQQIQEAQQATQNVTDNIQQIKQKQVNESSLQQLATLINGQQSNHPFPQIPVPPMQSIQPMSPPQGLPMNNMNTMNMIPRPPPPPPTRLNHGNNSNSNSSNNNGWLPSFFMFGNNNNNPSTTHSADDHPGSMMNNCGNINTRDMDIQSSPSTELPVYAREEKQNVLMNDDDDDVLNWQNDYGSAVAQPQPQINPLYDNPLLLKTKRLIGEGKFNPREKRQCGWILQNQSSTLLKISARLECVGGDKEQYGITVTPQKMYEFSLAPNEEVYILVEVEAPSICGKYAAFYQLVIDDGTQIGEMLEVMCHVVSQFDKQKESKIEQIIKMGFADRKQVVATLRKNKWDIQTSVDALIGQ